MSITTAEKINIEGMISNDIASKYVKSKLYLTSKRIFDIVASLCALIVLSPLFILLMLAICLESKGSPIYAQIRVGEGGRKFKFYKFRSMYKDADKQLEKLMALNEREGIGFKMQNDPRITKVGSFIRKCCLDEMPQLWNVLKGDMSVVGPRPALVKEVLEYTAYDMQRLSIMPGLTCYWQVNKAVVENFAEWVELDIKYIKERSVVVDILLILKTVQVMFLGKGDK